jgi:hypothetical protein
VDIKLMKNPENVRRHRRDIAQAFGREWDDKEELMTNDMYIGSLWGKEIDKIDSLGLLNRGFCPLCGIDMPSNDPRYSRGHRYSSAREFLCKDCYVRTNPFLDPTYVAAHHKAQFMIWAVRLGIVALIAGFGYGILFVPKVANIPTSLGILFALLGAAAMATWDRNPINRPLLFDSMGQILGGLLLLVMQIVITVGGISLAVWGIIYADWYIVLIAFLTCLAFVKALPFISHNVVLYLSSAFAPMVCAVGIIVLHFFTWFG